MLDVQLVGDDVGEASHGVAPLGLAGGNHLDGGQRLAHLELRRDPVGMAQADHRARQVHVSQQLLVDQAGVSHRPAGFA
jgi:hypothetical protein